MASIGDALIFMTKAAVLCVILVVMAVVWFVERKYGRDRLDFLATEREPTATIADLGDRLNTCLVENGKWPPEGTQQ